MLMPGLHLALDDRTIHEELPHLLLTTYLAYVIAWSVCILGGLYCFFLTFKIAPRESIAMSSFLSAGRGHVDCSEVCISIARAN